MFLQRVYRSTFEAAHFIEGHPKCGTKHGHSYKLVVYIDGDSDVWQDFANIKDVVDSYVQPKFDHKDIGNITAEEIALDIVNYLKARRWSGGLELSETDKYGIVMNF